MSSVISAGLNRRTQRQCAAAGRRHDRLEAAIVREIEQDAAELRVVPR
jgi:hypothetical protein